MVESLRSKEMEYTVGRAGLKVPTFELERVRTVMHVRKFFRKLWELTDYDLSIDYGNEDRPRSFDYELVLPPSGEKPLTVLRASYAARDRQAVQMDKVASSWSAGTNTIATGTENYSIVVPPEGLGPFEPVVSLQYVHETGTYFGDWKPNASLHWLGERVELNFATMPDDPNWPQNKQYEAWEATNRMRYRGVVAETARFLS